MLTNARGNILYTPELIAELKAAVVNLPRAEGVKYLVKRLKKSPRQARAIYATYIEKAITPKETMAVKVVQLKGRKIRRLFWDLETSPNVVLSWRIGYKISLDHSNILKERAIISIAYKWEGEDKVYALTWDDNQDDKAMLTEFLKVANEADEMVHHNGDKFDLPWFKTRCLFHGLQPLPDYKTADTLQWARRKLYFNSNKLDYIASFLGFGGKIKTEFGLWKDIVLQQDKEAMRKMVDYNKKDVVLLERVWKKLSRVVAPKTHVGVLMGNESWTNPHNGSENVKTEKVRVTAGGVVKYQMVDLDTGEYFTISDRAHQAYLEAKQARA